MEKDFDRRNSQYSFLALPLTTAPKPNPYRLPIGMGPPVAPIAASMPAR
jgi:hypothetical protein